MFETEIGEFLNLLGENIAAAPTDTLEDNRVHAIQADQIVTSISTGPEHTSAADFSSNNLALMR